MDTVATKRLTLVVDRHILSEAKKYSRAKSISLSKIVEGYLTLLTQPQEQQKQQEQCLDEITPYVAKLKAGFTLPVDFDYRATIADYLDKKYE
ncbi:MAG: DUF6364 family protein [Prevotellaceae bacterium]|jgi:hypothetical protein|nr:DUF6364 family protein [Prevotellaceae bacterium]